jgi:hypothetical protein
MSLRGRTGSNWPLALSTTTPFFHVSAGRKLSFDMNGKPSLWVAIPIKGYGKNEVTHMTLINPAGQS